MEMLLELRKNKKIEDKVTLSQSAQEKALDKQENSTCRAG